MKTKSIVKKEKKVNPREKFTALLNQFTKQQYWAKSKIEKIQKLLSRPSCKDWDLDKRKRIEERLSRAQLEYSQSFEFIDQIKLQLDQLL